MRKTFPVRTLAVCVALSVAASLIAVPAVPPDPREKGDPGDLSLRLSADEANVPKGKRPKLRVEIRNGGKRPVRLVLPGDGSESGWRTPIVGWSVLPVENAKAEHPKEPPLYRGARCGNINSLTASEVVTLKPGDRVEFGEWVGGPSLGKPGKYRVVFYYSNRPKLDWKGLPLGGHDPEAMARVRNSTACELRTNEIILTVTE